MKHKTAKPSWYLVEGKDKYWDGKKWLETQGMSYLGVWADELMRATW